MAQRFRHAEALFVPTPAANCRVAQTELSSAAIARHVARAIDLVAHLERRSDGRRVVSEIARVEDEVATVVWSHER